MVKFGMSLNPDKITVKDQSGQWLRGTSNPTQIVLTVFRWSWTSYSIDNGACEVLCFPAGFRVFAAHPLIVLLRQHVTPTVLN